MSGNHSFYVAFFIRVIVMRFHRRSAVRAGGMHADDIDAVAVLAGFLIDEFLIADGCLRIVFFLHGMDVHTEYHNAEEKDFKNNTAGTYARIPVFFHGYGS